MGDATNRIAFISGSDETGLDGEVVLTRSATGLQISVDGGEPEAIGAGISAVTTDATLTGDGTSGDPLKVAVPFAPATVPTGWTEVAITPGQNVDITLVGNTAYCIEISGYLVNGTASASTVSIQPNNVSTNQDTQEVAGAGGSSAADQVAALMICYCDASRASAFDCRFYMKVGIPRILKGSYTYLGAANDLTGNSNYGGLWTDTTTAITSLRIHSDQAAGIAAGSVIRYRIIPLA